MYGTPGSLSRSVSPVRLGQFFWVFFLSVVAMKSKKKEKRRRTLEPGLGWRVGREGEGRRKVMEFTEGKRVPGLKENNNECGLKILWHTGTGRQGKRAKWFILEESFVSQFDYFAAIVITKLLLNIFEHPFFDNACQLYHFFAFKFDSSWLFQSTEFPSILTKLKSANLWSTNWACSESNRVLKFRHNVCLGHKNNWLKGNLRHLATSLPFGPFTVKNVENWAITEPSCS